MRRHRAPRLNFEAGRIAEAAARSGFSVVSERYDER